MAEHLVRHQWLDGAARCRAALLYMSIGKELARRQEIVTGTPYNVAPIPWVSGTITVSLTMLPGFVRLHDF